MSKLWFKYEHSLPAKSLHLYFDYEPLSGRLTWGSAMRLHGRVAGYVNFYGYRIVNATSISSRGSQILIPAHQIVWAIVHEKWAESEVDHKNLDRLDNRIENLRLATSSQNKMNSSRKSPSSGFKGVSFRKDTGRYAAYINISGKRKSLGCFDDAAIAASEYDRAASQLFGDYARINGNS